MNLWSVGWPAGNWPDEQEWHLIWAWGSDEAVQIAWLIQEGENWGLIAPPDEDREDMIVQCHAGVDAQPRHPEPHPERRYRVMRLCGWRDEGDYPCEHCGLFPMGVVKQCSECNVCDECGGCQCDEEIE